MSVADVEQMAIATDQDAALEARIAALTDAALVYEQPLVCDDFQVLTASAIGAHTSAAGEHELDTRRPVAVISLTPTGITIEPIIDRERVLKTFLAALGVGLAFLARRH